MNNLSVIFNYKKQNRYSFNALAAALETDNRVNGIIPVFCFTEQDMIKQLSARKKRPGMTMVCFSVMTNQVHETTGLLNKLKKKFRAPGFVYVAGGPHPTAEPESMLKIGFDIAVIGEAEETFIDLINMFIGNLSEFNYANVKGIAYLDKTGTFHHTVNKQKIDINKYPSISIKHLRFGPIEVTRGCPYGCKFCQTTQLFGTKPRHRSIDSICSQIENMHSVGLTDIRLTTPNGFSYGSTDGKTLNLDKLELLYKTMKKTIHNRGKLFIGTFPSEVRPEHVTKDTISLIRKYADNDNLVIGGQSGSQRILDKCRRGHTVDNIHRAVELTVNSKLKANVDLIFGLPGETNRDDLLTVNLINRVVKLGARIHSHVFVPLPGTGFSNMPAGKMSKEIKSVLNKLIYDGRVYGDVR
jgi:B12-binding domain/radical SAM domain protein